MNYLVMECHPGYAVLLDEEGRFLKAANLRYETGQTVYDPVLMKETPERQRHTVRWISSGIAAIAACFLLFFGIGYYQNYLQPYSSIYLTINPEVQMDLNRQGTVVGLTGANEDGETLLEGYDGKGKDKITVADELIDRAIENLCRGKTVVIVAHRLGAIKLCDKVAVVENNTITCCGTHEEVLETGERVKKDFSALVRSIVRSWPVFF